MFCLKVRTIISWGWGKYVGKSVRWLECKWSRHWAGQEMYREQENGHLGWPDHKNAHILIHTKVFLKGNNIRCWEILGKYVIHSTFSWMSFHLWLFSFLSLHHSPTLTGFIVTRVNYLASLYQISSTVYKYMYIKRKLYIYIYVSLSLSLSIYIYIYIYIKRC